VVEVFVFYGYVGYSGACARYDWAAVADFWVNFDVGVFCLVFCMVGHAAFSGLLLFKKLLTFVVLLLSF
jgi:hypothetical protein